MDWGAASSEAGQRFEVEPGRTCSFRVREQVCGLAASLPLGMSRASRKQKLQWPWALTSRERRKAARENPGALETSPTFHASLEP
eukprot:5414623-Alexandrium_andersonii.AAC.1